MVAASASAAAESQDAAAAAAATASPRQVFLTPTGAVVVGFTTAQAYAKVYRGRVTADQRVSLVTGSLLLLLMNTFVNAS